MGCDIDYIAIDYSYKIDDSSYLFYIFSFADNNEILAVNSQTFSRYGLLNMNEKFNMIGPDFFSGSGKICRLSTLYQI